jgi:putative photosynthetic complex assembly protein 2
MSTLALAIGSVVVVWWLSTGLVLGLVWLPSETHRWSVAVASVLAVVGFYGAFESSLVRTVGAAYLGFGCALAIWAWHELTFLLGMIAGPRKTPCPPEVLGWQRFRYATATVIHHELALAATVLALLAITWNAPNQVATGTFLVLWIMRLSAKLNVFVGVRNLSQDFVPPHLRYLTSYFRRARPGLLMLVSVLGAGAALWPLAAGALSTEASDVSRVGHALVATMLALAILEHLFLALPISDAWLWRWALRVSRASNDSPVRNDIAVSST